MEKLIFRKAEADRVIAWPCLLQVPQDGGKFAERQLTVKFRQLPPERVAELVDPLKAIGRNGDLAIYDAVVTGFDGLTDESGASVADGDAIALFRTLTYALSGVVRGYFDMQNGRVAKN
jgi:hypothetical protein